MFFIRHTGFRQTGARQDSTESRERPVPVRLWPISAPGAHPPALQSPRRPVPVRQFNDNSVCRKFRQPASDGKNYQVKYYNLDAVISVGYRVNSVRATQFRQWCTNILRQFAIRGYVIDKKRIDSGTKDSPKPSSKNTASSRTVSSSPTSIDS